MVGVHDEGGVDNIGTVFENAMWEDKRWLFIYGAHWEGHSFKNSVAYSAKDVGSIVDQIKKNGYPGAVVWCTLYDLGKSHDLHKAYIEKLEESDLPKEVIEGIHQVQKRQKQEKALLDEQQAYQQLSWLRRLVTPRPKERNCLPT